MAVRIVTAILTLLAGIGVFLLAVKLLSRNIEALSGDKLRGLFSKTSKSKLLGVGLGTLTAAVIQSSGAVTVMVIGFINAGLMDLTQGSVIAFGANIGTTITGQIVALGMFGGENTITSTLIFTALTGVGAFINLFAKKDFLQKVGSIIAGFGLLFVGLETMGSSMSSFAEMEGLRTFISGISNPVLLILIGVAVTALLQSSSVMSSILITMVFSGLININQGIYIIMGSNIGAGIVALLAAVGGSADAKRVSVIHLVFNTFGAVVFLIIGVIVNLSTGGKADLGTPFELLFAGAPQTQLAMFHTVYNVLKVALFLPFTNLTCKLFTKIIKDKKVKEEEISFAFIEEHFLKTPPIAVKMVKEEAVRMFGIAMENFNLSVKTVCELDFSEENEFKKREATLNFLNKNVTKFIVKIPQDMINGRDRIFLSTAYKVVSDMERIGDYAENIVEYAYSLKENGLTFSEDAIQELKVVSGKINDIYGNTLIAFRDGDRSKLKAVYAVEDEVDKLTKDMSDNHVERMNKGICQPEVGALYLELSSNLERIADHMVNIAKSIKKYTPKT